jgi:HAD superfamily hydrolase (TIGR01549 family)
MPALLLDIDGTLVDSNYQHALAWFRALREQDITQPLWQIHRAIGMGGDQLVEHLCGEAVEAEHGDTLRERDGELYREMLDEVQPLAHARRLLEALDAQGTTVVLASSTQEEDLDHYLDLLDARPLLHGWTTSADVDATKPAPDLLEVALEKAGTRDAVMLGDATWDAKAAANAGIPCVGLLTGGFSREELLEAGCREVYDDLGAIVDALPGSLAP